MTDIIKVFAKLKEVEYNAQMMSELSTYSLNDLKNNVLISQANFILYTSKNTYAFSQWVSPKRTRSFPYARIYNTLGSKNRVALIPFCKDEGLDGDRDFIQWDTVSLMSLLNVHIIITYYIKAEKNNRPNQRHKNKITKQIYDYGYIAKQLNDLENYQSSALHWNLKQIDNLESIAKLTLEHYQNISNKTGVKLHSNKGIKNRISIISHSVNKFKNLSRELAQKAQHRESITIQPKEQIISAKASITMKNLLGGYYFMTADECLFLNGKLFLIEKKHSAYKLLPSENDIKDSFIKMALFTNISQLEFYGKNIPYQAVIGLTSNKIKGFLHSKMSTQKIEKFIHINTFKIKEKQMIIEMLKEAKCNKFEIFVINANQTEKQKDILFSL